LPSSPKIFHGRESELASVVSTLLCDPARAAILGAGGMGKTTLATAALHHPTIIEKYAHRHFISCESASNSVDLVSIVGSHLGLEPSRQIAKAIVRHLTECGTSLVVLDNLETPWESSESRGQVEEFLSLLADVPTLSLLITMRGAERPGKVKWTRPFLPPLEPLSALASRQIFFDVTDNLEIAEEAAALDELLELSGNLPLAVSLLASVVSIEGYSGALARWKIETTAVVSDGYDKRSNLEQSIRLSLGSPRISSPHAKDLLSLLSLLPDGITEEDLLMSKVPIPDISQCRASLVRTSLAYTDASRRLKALSPIREYMRKAYPPSPSLYGPLRIHFQDLLEVWNSHQELFSRDLVPKIYSSLGNISDLI
ncbi:P-loop containing nucleoside triphosphate hydrolase protein, partial [Mycena latifolia]